MGNAFSCCSRASSPSLYHASRLHKYETGSNSSRRASATHEHHNRRRSTASPTTSGFIDGQDYNSASHAQPHQQADYFSAVMLNDAGQQQQQITHYRRKPSSEKISSGYFDCSGENVLLQNSTGVARHHSNAAYHQQNVLQYISSTRQAANNIAAFHQQLNGQQQQQHFDTDEEGYVSENRTPIIAGLHHISEREPGDGGDDPSSHPTLGPIFKRRSRMCLDKLAGNSDKMRKRRSAYFLNSTGTPSEASMSGRLLRKFNSCSTIYIDDSTISQPNLRSTLKCVALAIYFHIQQREHAVPSSLDIFDERLHPIARDSLPADHWERNPEHRHIYRFLRLLFHAAQLTAEVAIITLVYLERLLTYAELDIAPINWKRMVLGSVMLASKVWDDQAVWNVDYCQILREVDVDDMNELERAYLEALQFNINIPASVYAKYYFHLRDLADEHPDLAPIKWESAAEPLRLDRAVKLEALSRLKSNTLHAASSAAQQNPKMTTAAGGDAPPPNKPTSIVDQIMKSGGQPGVSGAYVNNNAQQAGDAGAGAVNGASSAHYIPLRRLRSNSVDNSAAQQNRRSIAILS